MENTKNPQVSADKMATEGNQCIAMGLGVGGLGTAAALTVGAVCPLCLIVAPGLLGVGILQRFKARWLRKKDSNQVTIDNLESS